MSGSCSAPAGTSNSRRAPACQAGARRPPGARSQHPHPNQVTPPAIRCLPRTSLPHGLAGQKVELRCAQPS